MTTINGPDLWDVLKKEGYDCDKLSDDEWEVINEDWEDECQQYLKIAIENNNKKR